MKPSPADFKANTPNNARRLCNQALIQPFNQADGILYHIIIIIAYLQHIIRFVTLKKNIDKIESSQKKTIRLLMGLPRISHTAEAFWALNTLPFRKLGISNLIKFLFQFKDDRLSPIFKLKKHQKRKSYKQKHCKRFISLYVYDHI